MRNRLVNPVVSKKVRFEQRHEAGKEKTIRISGKRIFHIEGIASAKTLRQEIVWYVWKEQRSSVAGLECTKLRVSGSREN